MKGRSKKIQHWGTLQDLHYHFFLILKSPQLDQKKKATKIYVEMARFIGTRSSTQCRTHHEKKIDQLRKAHRDAEKDNLRRFYYEAYTIRRLGQEHLRHELTAYLKELKDKKTIKSQQFDTLEAGIGDTLANLALDQQVWTEPPSTGDSSSSREVVEKEELSVVLPPFELQQEAANDFFFSGSEDY